MMEIIVTRDGLPANITVVSPIGYGLEQKAVEAVSKWRFFPAEKDGVPVAVHATVEMNFRLLNTNFDPQKEQMRTKFNLMLRDVIKHDSKLTPTQEAAMWEFAKHDFSSAQYVFGVWYLSEANPSRDEKEGVNFIQRAAKNHHPAAMYAEARLELEGKTPSQGPQSRRLGDGRSRTSGQLTSPKRTGLRYQSGLDVTADPERARRYFRSCARSGDADCQYRLGKSLWTKPGRSQSELLQSVAWLQIASDAGNV